MKPALEFVDGKVVRKMSPQPAHGLIQGRISQLIQNWLDANGGGFVMPEVRLRVGGSIIVPDLMVYGPGALDLDRVWERDAYMKSPPDLLIEILAPGQTMRAMTRRFTKCLDAGVPRGWLVRPKDRTVLIFGREGERVLEFEQPVLGEGDVAGLQVSLGDYFRR